MGIFKSQGRQNYERCANKQVTTTGPKDGILYCAATAEEGFAVTSRGHDRTLPVLMAVTIGKAMCGGCRFVDMTREEVHAMRTQEAVAATVRLEAEHRLELLQRQLYADNEPLPGPQETPPAIEG